MVWLLVRCHNCASWTPAPKARVVVPGSAGLWRKWFASLRPSARTAASSAVRVPGLNAEARRGFSQRPQRGWRAIEPRNKRNTRKGARGGTKFNHRDRREHREGPGAEIGMFLNHGISQNNIRAARLAGLHGIHGWGFEQKVTEVTEESEKDRPSLLSSFAFVKAWRFVEFISVCSACPP